MSRNLESDHPVIEVGTDPVRRQPTDSARIVGLLSPRRPSNISRFIPAIVIDAVQGVPTGAVTDFRRHICEEIGELTPTLAQGDAATTIESKVRIARICAPLDHRCPYAIDRMDGPTAGISVLDVVSQAEPMNSPTLRSPQAAAGLRMATQQSRARNHRVLTAIAGASPANTDRKSTRLNSSHVSESRMPSSA